MPTSPTLIVKQRELYFCEPDPQDTIGSEQAGDRVWCIVSIPQLRRGNCVVALPLSRHMEKAGAHLIKVPLQEITVEGDDPNIDRHVEPNRSGDSADRGDGRTTVGWNVADQSGHEEHR